MNVSACLVTRGDVDMQPILDSLPKEWEKIVWINGRGVYNLGPMDGCGDLVFVPATQPPPDLAVYGRYAAIEYASHDLIFVQDDDVIVSDPQAIVDAWLEHCGDPRPRPALPAPVVCNMPPEFRPHYPDSGLVGFGAAFHRDAPERAFKRWFDGASLAQQEPPPEFYRRADNIFTVLTPRVLVNVPKTDCAYASDPNRMWRQSDHVGERDRMIELARQVRDA